MSNLRALDIQCAIGTDVTIIEALIEPKTEKLPRHFMNFYWPYKELRLPTI